MHRSSWLSNWLRLLALYFIAGATVFVVAVVGVFFFPAHGESDPAIYSIVVFAVIAGSAAWSWAESLLFKPAPSPELAIVMVQGFVPAQRRPTIDTSSDFGQVFIPRRLIAASFTGIIILSCEPPDATPYAAHVIKLETPIAVS